MMNLDDDDDDDDDDDAWKPSTQQYQYQLINNLNCQDNLTI